MTPIKTIKIGFPIQQDAVSIFIRPLINCTSDLTCNTYWEIMDENNNVLANGNTPLDEVEYAQWGADNTSLEDIVLAKLNLERK